MKFEEWYKKRIYKDKYFDEVAQEAWNAAVEATKKTCAEAVCNSCPGGDVPCFEKPPGCEIYKTIMKAEVK